MPNNLTTTQAGSDDNAAAFVPTAEWVSQLGSSVNDSAFGVAVDREGNVYLTGTTEGDLGGPNAGGEDAWVAKYDPSGTRLWVKQWGTADDERFNDVTVDSNGTVYVTGITGVFEELGYEYDVADILIVKYDSNGELLETQQLGDADEFDKAEKIEVDGSGNVYIMGHSGSDSIGVYGGFVAKYDSSGNQQWAQGNWPGGAEAPMLEDFAVDSAGNVYAAGNRGLDTWSGVLTKYDSSGGELWSNNFSPVYDISLDGANNIYATYSGGLVKYDSNGNKLREQELNDYGRFVGGDREGNVYVLTSIGYGDEKEEKIVKFDGSGNLLWEEQVASELNVSAFLVDSEGKIYLTGSTEDSLSGNNAGGTDAWVGKLDPNAAAAASKALTLDEGTTLAITSNELNVADELPYTITALPTNGSLKLNNAEVAIDDTFTQADIDGGKLTYTHDGSETAKDSFSFIGIPSNPNLTNFFPITINPINDVPTDILLSNSTVESNNDNDTVIGTLKTTDVDSDAHSYALVDDAEGRFVIENNLLKVGDRTLPNSEERTSYTIRVRTTENSPDAQSFEKDLTIGVFDGIDIEWNQQSERLYWFSEDLAVDKDDNIYLVGSDATSTTTWIAKHDSNGDRLWQKESQEVLYLEPNIAVDHQGNTYITSKQAAYPYFTVVIKYDNNGDRLWQAPFEINDSASASGLVVDGDGNVYMTGFIDNWDNRNQRAWIVKYDSQGKQLWQQELNANGYDKSNDVVVDNQGNVYITGSTEGDLAATNAGGGDSFLAKYDPNGNQLWMQQWGTSGSENATSIAIDSNNNLYVVENITERFDGTNPPDTDVFLGKYDSEGNQLWMQQLGTEKIDLATSVVVDSKDRVYISVDSRGNLAGSNVGSLDTFVAAYDGDGKQQWVKNLGTVGDDFSGEVAVDSNGKLYVIGKEQNNNSWLAKLNPNIAPTAIANNNLTVDEGTTDVITNSHLQITDADNAPITYTVTALPTAGSLQLNSAELALNDTFTQTDIDTGNLAYSHNGSETTNDNFSFTVTDGNGGEIENADFSIKINPVNDAPTDVTLNKNTVKENSKTGTLIGKLTTVDDSDAHTYTLVENPGGRFVIEGNELKVADGSKLDFEATTSHTITVRTADNGEPAQSFEKELVITVTDIEDNTVKSTTNHRLGATKENLNLAGKDTINGIGNNLDNRISGNNAKNRVRGKDGNDVLIGRGGNDILIGDKGRDRLAGNRGNDLLNGGPGIDTMNGGPGNDTYIANHTKDVVKEGKNRGTDVVKSSADYNLGAHIENLNLVGKGAINGIGNNFDNRISGNNAKNRIIGKDGNDVLIGRGGNDVLIGDKGSDRLIGNQGNDLINGDVGNDILIGGGGSDRFIFNSGKSYRKASPGQDVIRDFKNRDNDRIILDKTTFGALDSKAGRGFSVIAEFDVVNRNAAVGNSDAVIVYNQNNGSLFYNANGSKSGLGTGGVFAVLDNSPQLEANDFIVRT